MFRFSIPTATYLTKWLLPVAIPLTIGVLAVVGIVILGNLTLDQVRGQPRYRAGFSEIQCDAPPGLSREDFLHEVQYLSQFPDQLGVLEGSLAPRLVEAFSRHPWVRAVQRIEVTPTRQVRVRLQFRVPVLAVPQDKQVRAIDGAGVLLPITAQVSGMVVYEGTVSPPQGPPGTLWGDAKMLATARTLEFLHGHPLYASLVKANHGPEGVFLNTTTGQRIIWGKPPGEEVPPEPRAEEKRVRLQQILQKETRPPLINLRVPMN